MSLAWKLRDRILFFEDRPLILGIVNVTPDSFSDGGQHADAVAHALTLVAEGADLLDIGGESTRPGATPVTVAEELARVMPVLVALRKQTSVPISVDTMKAEVAREALAAGADIINDVTALTAPMMVDVVRAANAGAILMHMQGTPATMQQNPVYTNVVDEVKAYLKERVDKLGTLGISADKLVLDPGIGFGKTFEHTMEQLSRLSELGELGRPICLGVSRKGFLKALTGRERGERAVASALVAFYGALEGAGQILRVHDVGPTRDAARLVQALVQARARFSRPR